MRLLRSRAQQCQTPVVGTAGAILAKDALPVQHGHLEQGRAAAGALTGGKRDHFRS